MDYKEKYEALMNASVKLKNTICTNGVTPELLASMAKMVTRQFSNPVIETWLSSLTEFIAFVAKLEKEG